MGDASHPDVLHACACAADRAGLDSLWLGDHIAIPPDDAEGSNGRYLDILSTLSYLAAATERIELAAGVLNLPFRRPLMTARAVATAQELSRGRLILGVGLGWMPSEFQALGLDRKQRGRVTDETLAFLHECFGAENDVVTANGQAFYFRPNPPRPPIIVGGNAPHAIERALRFGDGWMPMGDPRSLGGEIRELNDRFADAGKPPPEVISFAAPPGDDVDEAIGQAQELAALGLTRIVYGMRYAAGSEYQEAVERAAAVIAALQ